ncbi:MAG: ribosomal protein S18 acetylase RimI-like enzyme [Bacteroidia bacterium]|jgi:ribosomal protein S18 acetylase RimI-like enzyme
MFSFRILSDPDFEQWNAIRTEALEVAPFAFGRSNEDELPERDHRFKVNINRKDRFIHGAFDGEKLIGISGFYRHEPIKTFHKGTVWSVFIKPQYQGKGLGRKLMEETLLEAWEMADLETILIGVSSNNPTAFNLYKNLGFAEYGREPNCLKHKGEYVDEILMVMHKD